MQNLSFSELQLHPALLRAVADEGYSTPTPIQSQAIPHLVEGCDLLGVAQTGTGKTAAFALPILHRLAASPRRAPARSCRVLVLSPTRELAIQIAERFEAYGRHLGLTSAVIFGGVGQGPQVRSVLRGLDVLVATPGRLLDLMGQGHLSLSSVEVFVLDEADRMLDMGFIHDVRRVINVLPARRQTLLFSATMPDAIAELSSKILRDPKRVEVTPVASTVDRIEQRVLMVEKADKPALLCDVLRHLEVDRAIVFTRTKHGADKVARKLLEDDVTAEAIHGNKSQNARQRALENFRAGRTRILVATDIAARGIDVPGVSHVINFDLPNEPESYVHRIGRTARAGADGMAISFCDAEERAYLRDIERLIRRDVRIVEGHPYESRVPRGVIAPPTPRAQRPQQRRPSQQHARPVSRPQRRAAR
jgi:ATP-dependent RNA helicase RhlE